MAFGLLVTLLAYEVYVVGVDYSNYFAYLIDAETAPFIAIALICMGLSYLVFYRLIAFTLSASWPYRVFCLILFSLSVTVEYGYQKALGRFTDKADLQTAIAATPDQQIASIMMYLSFAALIPGVVLLSVALFVRAEKPRGSRQFLVVFASLIVGFAIFPFVVDQKFPTFATNAFVRTVTDVLVYGPLRTGNLVGDLTGQKMPRRPVQIPLLPQGYTPDRNIVIVVDESTMGDHFSLNGYARKTTPFLEELAAAGILHNWGIAAAASTGSRFTYNALITGLGPDDFPDRSDFKINSFPMLFQYAKAMGYRTHFFDGQMNVYWGANQDDKNYIDSWKGIIDITGGMGFESWEVDNILARQVKEIINRSTGNFIFVFKYGSHIPYHLNFPPDQKVWSPSYESTNKFDIPAGDQLPAVLNAYDNSIQYNVDSFFGNLVDDYAAMPNNTLIIYTGDHGQTLFRNGRSSHGGNTRAEATVPLLIIGRLETPVDTEYRASHGNIFPTVLDIIGYPAELREVQRFPSLLKARQADSRLRYFNPDLGTKIAFD